MTAIKKIKCLIVEDEPLAQKVLKKYIEQVNALELVDICNSAVEAISLLQNHSIDLIFLDIQMPELLGTTFIRTLNKPPKVIFTTAYRKYAVVKITLGGFLRVRIKLVPNNCGICISRNKRSTG